MNTVTKYQRYKILKLYYLAFLFALMYHHSIRDNMQVHSINNQTNFKGIKLSTNEDTKVRETVKKLIKEGYYCLGKKDLFCSNTNVDIINKISSVREKAKFYKKEFGVLFLPWSKSAYIVSSKSEEQELIKNVQKFDPDAKLNLAI